MPGDRVLTTAEVAAALRVSRQTVTRWIRKGSLRAVVIQASSRPIYRVSERDLRDFVRRYVEGSD